MIYLELFWSFFQIGLFSIGGGYAAMPLIQHQVVDLHPWLTMTQFADIMTIAEMTPGPIAINSATFVGIQIAGLPGAVIATAGCVFPSCVIVLTLAWVYYRFRGLTVIQGVLAGLRPAVVAMIASAGISLLIMALYGQRAIPADIFGMDYIALSIFMAGFFVLRKWKVSPMCIMAGAGVAGVILYAVFWEGGVHMRYTIRAGMLYEENRQESLIHMKGIFSGPEKHICLPNEEWVLRTFIRDLPAPPRKRSDVRFREYVMLDPDGAEIARGKPDYAQGEDPAVTGWPICRMPRVDHADVTIQGKPYALIMHNSQNYALTDPTGYTVVQIMHRGLCGGWNIEADGRFSPGILCGLFAFCRYMEHENELMIV